MLLWIMIIISLLVAWMGFKKGFYVMFATFFNLMFAILISVLTTPTVMRFSSGYETSAYYAAASIFLLFVLVFGLLQAFSYFFILQGREDFFPKILDKVGSTVLGFLCGYLVCCLLVLVFCIMPCSSHGKAGWCSRKTMQDLSVPGIRKVCNFVGWYSLHCFAGNVEYEIEHLMSLGENSEGIQINPEELIPYVGAVKDEAKESKLIESDENENAGETDRPQTP